MNVSGLRLSLAVVAVLVLGVVAAPVAAAPPAPVLDVTLDACKNFATDQVEWTITWDGNVFVTGGWLQALDPDAAFGSGYWELGRRDWRRQGSVNGALSNEQPWAASLADVFVVQARVYGYSEANKAPIEVVIDPFFDPPLYPEC